MRTVDVFRRRPDTEIEHLGRLTVSGPGEPARFEVLIPELREGLEQMMADGVADPRGGWRQLDDGEAFLDAVLEAWHGSRFWATEVDASDAG